METLNKDTTVINPHQFENIQKILTTVSKHSSTPDMRIVNSKLITDADVSTVIVDFTEELNTDNFSIDIPDHKTNVRLLKQIDTKEDIIVYPDEDEKSYKILYKQKINNKSIVYTLKFDMIHDEFIISSPYQIDTMDKITEAEIPGELFKNVLNISNALSSDITFLVYNNNLIGFSIGNRSTITLDESVDNIPDDVIELTSKDFKLFGGDNVYVEFYKDPFGGYVGVYTYKQPNGIKLQLQEPIDDKSEMIEF